MTKKNKIEGTETVPALRRHKKPYDPPQPRTPYNAGVSMTQQQFHEESKISTIIKKYDKTGILGTGNGTRKPLYGDFTQNNYTEMQQKLALSKEKFDEYPDDIKKIFEYNPQNLVAFLSDSNNRDDAIELGLIPKPEKEPEQAPIRVVVDNPQQTAASSSDETQRSAAEQQ